MTRLKKTFIKNLFLSLLAIQATCLHAQETKIDQKITQILQASAEEKKVLIKDLKLQISNIRYDETNASSTKTSLDAKIKKRKECSSDMKCGSGKCGSAKCGYN